MASSQLESSFLYYFGKTGSRRGSLRDMAKDLSSGILKINVNRVVGEELTSLTKFLSDKQTLLQVRTLVVTAKPSTQSISKEQRSTAKKHQQHETRECPALFFDELFSLVCRFVSVSTGLYTLIFDQIGYFEGKHFRSFSLFLSKSKTVKWLCIRKCSLGDTGLCYLTKPLINLPFQVLILESCGLTDKACPMLSSVLRAHEASRDVMAWNAFLRASPEELRSAEAWSERSHIQSSGLMLVSIKGNLVTSSGICRLLEAVRTSCWLLGLKLSSNQISRRGILNFLDGLSEHCGLAALVLDNNPGFSECMRSRVADKLNRSSSVCIPDACHALLQRWKSRQTGLSTPSGDFVGTGSATMTSTPVTSRSTSEGKVYAFIDPPTSGEVVFDSDEALTPHSSDAMNRKPINQEKVTATEVEIAAIITPQQNESEEFTEAEKIAVQAALRAKILQYMHDRTY